MWMLRTPRSASTANKRRKPPRRRTGRRLEGVAAFSFGLSRLLEQLVPPPPGAALPRTAVPGVRGDQRNHGGGLGEHHLLPGHVHLAPGAGLLERGRRAGAVAH